jgi:DNA-binding CsgD family transcriptional regulator
MAMLGQLDQAQRSAQLVLEITAADPTIGPDEAPARVALGIVALSRGDYAGALLHLRIVDAVKRKAGISEPRMIAHASDLAEALLGYGELAEADETITQFEMQAATSAGQWSLAASARCRALWLAAMGDLDAALARAQAALSRMDTLPMPFERARTVYALGQIHRRRKEKRLARQAFTEALAAFDELGTPVWADRTRAELTRIPQRRPADDALPAGPAGVANGLGDVLSGPGVIGGPAPAPRAGPNGITPQTLTPTEGTIAALAAQGLTNREIADRTFLSPKTVEVNLTRIYRKLGVRSRAALAGRLFAGR